MQVRKELKVPKEIQWEGRGWTASGSLKADDVRHQGPTPHATPRAIPAVGSIGPLIVGRCGCAAAQVERRRQQLDRFFNMVSMLPPEPKRVAACLTGGWGVGSS